MTTLREEPGPGQESVWDYPRPPDLQRFEGHIKIFFEDVVVAEAHEAYRVLETSHPPTFYLPPSSITPGLLKPISGTSMCEWKGQASYFALEVEQRVINRVGWTYRNPVARFAAIKDFVCFYPSKVKCFVDGEGVKAQEGDFYGGWITSKIVGPFKGGPGTWGW